MDYAVYPTFSSENLSIWFAQMESLFALNVISDDSQKYACILVYVPSESLRIVKDIVLNPPTTNKYEFIKHEFIKRIIVKKLMTVEFDNETPSAYLRKLKDIAGERVSNEEILNIWLNNLPEKVRQLVNLGNYGDMDRLCEIAERAIVLMTPTAQSTTSLPEPKKDLSHKKWCEMMKRRMNNLFIKELEKHMDNHDYDQDDEQQSSSQESILKVQKDTLNTSNSNSIRSSSKKICWYHTQFGDKAIACVAPCQYKICCPTKNLLRK